MSKTFILLNSTTEKLLPHYQKNSSLNNQVPYPFFMSNELIDFSESIFRSQIPYIHIQNSESISNEEFNVTNFGYIFVTTL